MYTQCKHRGFVMVSYYDLRDANNAMRALQNKPFHRRRLDIHYSIPKTQSTGSPRVDGAADKDNQNQGTLVVFNLDPSLSNDELRLIFGRHGEVKEIRETPNKRHHKFVEFYDTRHAERAMLALNKCEIRGKKIKIELSRPGGVRRNQVMPAGQDEDSDGYDLPSPQPHTAPISIRSSPQSSGVSTPLSLIPAQVLATHQQLPQQQQQQQHLQQLQQQLQFQQQMQAFTQSPVDTLSDRVSAALFGMSPQPPQQLPQQAPVPQQQMKTSPLSEVRSYSPLMGSHSHMQISPAPPLAQQQQFQQPIPAFNLFGSGVHQSMYSTQSPFASQPSSLYSSPVQSSHTTPAHSRASTPRFESSIFGVSGSPVASPRGSPPPSTATPPGAFPGFMHQQQASAKHYAAASAAWMQPVRTRTRAGSDNVMQYSLRKDIAVRDVAGAYGPSFIGRDAVTSPSLATSLPSVAPLLPPLSESPQSIGAASAVGAAITRPVQGRLRSESMQEERQSFKVDADKLRSDVVQDSRTTLMIRNIPNKYTQKMLLQAIDEHHKGCYDFFYLPIDFKNKCNVGYAFINFIHPSYVLNFYLHFNNKKWDKFNSEKVCEITYARIQGKGLLVAHFQNSSLLSEDKKCRPILFRSQTADGDLVHAYEQEPFPTGPNVRQRKSSKDMGQPAGPAPPMTRGS
eukprot:TRINITY_DN287_c0_g1_i2.p1 TRINITY_DN287_c0_g1~~TRINITY_DN287_c0_g1_i2.p1  ORF type:complete len:680 (-),score=166.96 TRINITY_DN287_c0_g1_i2:351-2390(-)